MNKKDFPLTGYEEKLEWILLIIALISFVIIGLGMYYQNSNGNISLTLVPLLFFVFGTFFILLGYNGLKRGNLLPKWMPFFFNSPRAFIENRTVQDELTVRKFGAINLSLGVLLYILSLLNLPF